METNNLKYRFINWIAKRLNADDIIDYDYYNELVPYIHKPSKIKEPEGLLKFPESKYGDLIRKMPATSFYDRLKDIGYNKSDKSFTWYEAPRDKPIE